MSGMKDVGFTEDDFKTLTDFTEEGCTPCAIIVSAISIEADANGGHTFGSRIGFPETMDSAAKVQLIDLIFEELKSLRDTLVVAEPEPETEA